MNTTIIYIALGISSLLSLITIIVCLIAIKYSNSKLERCTNILLMMRSHLHSILWKEKHILPIKIANTIAGYENEIDEDDMQVLKHFIMSLKDNLDSEGYKYIDMLGKDYADNMDAKVTYLSYGTVTEGKEVITRVIKPLLQYNRETIQSAEYIVSKN